VPYPATCDSQISSLDQLNPERTQSFIEQTALHSPPILLVLRTSEQAGVQHAGYFSMLISNSNAGQDVLATR